MKFDLHGLATAQRDAAARVGPLVTCRDGHLAGGTAASLYLGHRRSVDLDYFFRELPDPETLAQELEALNAGFQVEHVARGTLHASFAGVPISFLEFRYPLLEAPVEWPAGKCRVASVRDLASLKLNAVAQRGHRKDFYDVFALGTSPCPLAEMLAAYQARFQIRDLGHVLMGLTYFADADKQPDPLLLKAMPWDRVKAAIQGWVRDFVSSFPAG